ncbi:hypothetical protein LEP1GSC188_0790 [Leptospira weilii serovar Topaz str. LT2116]|uniref:Uncharacterized protein n=1 Tax=Leptospira weilii serovar Topaz str. LT2116 TaxID=1088540 RepID=M3G7M5_9LEPT|nr:hypothetical protein LEP1GSC188_0790 [Leptospira weilii serovar Topaz str. LT2116]
MLLKIEEFSLEEVSNLFQENETKYLLESKDNRFRTAFLKNRIDFRIGIERQVFHTILERMRQTRFF